MKTQQQLIDTIDRHIEVIYGDLLNQQEKFTLTQNLLAFTPSTTTFGASLSLWSEKTLMMITYGDTIIDTNEHPLRTLKSFLDARLQNLISHVHILPFFPYSSDDGFAVKDFYSVDERLGQWQDIQAIAKDYDLMADLVINHGSSTSEWFDKFQNDEPPYNNYYFTVDTKQFDISAVTRPRTNPLLKQVNTPKGTKHLWCTFSHDQIDFNFQNPEVLLEFIRIINFYLSQGIRVFRLDAVGFLWKASGTTCLSLPQTHEVIRLIRTLLSAISPESVIITETNIPNQENLSYFGNGNEAHCIYNFSLPPLLVNTLVTGNCTYLKQWMLSMPPAQPETAYFNFIASHDGIGLRPVEGLLSDNDIDQLIKTMESFGGKISYRTTADGTEKPYEMNIALVDALKGTTKGEDDWGISRFICAQAIMLALEGIPGIYIHSLLGTSNDYDKLNKTQHNRAINRSQWHRNDIDDALDATDGKHHKIFQQYKRLLYIRRQEKAFHPNAKQVTLHLGSDIFGFWRESIDEEDMIYCLYNISLRNQVVPLSTININLEETWLDLLTQKHYKKDNDCIVMSPYQVVWLKNQI
ncbi:MAG: sugar phosphorylase [Cellvibrionales bacterium]|nr:sugar phosphorylase [Cellvibrionales bacterium]